VLFTAAVDLNGWAGEEPTWCGVNLARLAAIVIGVAESDISASLCLQMAILCDINAKQVDILISLECEIPTADKGGVMGLGKLIGTPVAAIKDDSIALAGFDAVDVDIIAR